MFRFSDYHVLVPRRASLLFAFFILLSNFTSLQAQCPTGCDIEITGANSTNYTLNLGDTMCLQSGAVYTGTVTMTGGVLYNCASATQSFIIDFNSGSDNEFHNHGTYDFGSSDVHNDAEVWNYGTILWSGTLDVANGGTLHNFGAVSNSSSTLRVAVDADGFYNYNSGTVSVNDFALYNDIFNSGQITINADWSIFNSSLNVTLDGGCVDTDGFLNSATINGITCSTITITGSSSNNSAASILGNIAIVDNPTFPFVDSNFGTIAGTVTGTSCGCPGCSVAFTAVGTDVSCFGAGDGGIDVTITGGTAPYTIDWDNDGTGDNDDTEDLSGLGPGTYNVTITDANFCPGTATVVISEPAELTLGFNETNITCFSGSDGEIDMTITGGIGTPGIDWDNLGGTSDPEDQTGLTFGTYNVTVTNSPGCSTSGSVSLTQPTEIIIVEDSIDHVQCHGDFTGAIYLSASGGVGALSYSWDNLPGSPDPLDNTTLPTGTYNLTVTDQSLCTATYSQTINEPAATLGLSSTFAEPSCFGIIDGSIDLTITGGTSPYVLDWDNIVGTDDGEDQDPIGAGTYNVTVTDANDCTETHQVIVTQPAQITLALNRTNVTCFGGSDGAIDMTITGAVGSPTIEWDNLPGSPDPEDQTGLIAGTYNVTVTDASSCTATGGITIFQPGAIIITEDSLFHVDCFGENDGGIYLSATGGFRSLTYEWNNMPGSSDPLDNENISGGTYSLTVTDESFCTATYSQTINEPSAALNLSSTFVEPTCNGLVDGSIDLTISGGTTPYLIDWDNIVGVDNSEDQDPIGAGTYNVTVTDANDCVETHQIIVTSPATMNVSESVTHNLCFGDTLGTIDVTVVGGVTPYTYNWGHISGTNNAEDLIDLGADTYNLTVTDFNGCTSTTTVSVTEPAELTIGETHVDVSCFGGSDGSIDLVVNGGVSLYTYNWFHISGTDNSANISGLSAGDYTIVVTDGNSCTDTAIISIAQPALIELTETHNDVSCFGASDGSIDISISGGNGSTRYDWVHIPGPNNSQDLTGLSNGTYELIATDVLGCDDTITIDITGPIAGLVVTNNNINESCPGNMDGQVAVSVTGGTSPYNFDWGHIPGPSNNDTLFNHAAGTYNLTVTDNNGCTDIQNITLDNDPIFNISHTQINVDCNGNNTGSIDISVSGGTPSYNYDWSHIPGPNNVQDPQNLVDGNYSLTISDATGCSAVYAVDIIEPEVLTINDSQTNVSCFGGSDGTITINMTGGTSPFTYQWGHVPDNVNSQSSLSMGTYDLTVTDDQGCTTSTSIAITEPTDMILSETHIDVSCNGGSDGSINLTVNGGTVATDYQYDWNNDGTGDFDDLQDLTGLMIGTYNVVVRDDNGCQKSISADIFEPAVLTLSESHIDVYCNGDADGSIDITPNGGTAPFTYEWSHLSGSGDPQDVGSLVAGDYTVTVTDNQSCTVIETVTISSTITITLSDTHTDISCNGGSDGSINLTISGNGTSPYTIDWDNDGTGDNDDSQFLSGLVVGTYNVTVVDFNGCSISDAVTLTEPTLLTSTATHDSTTCYSLTDGTATITPAGGTPGYTYAWSNGGNTPTITGLSAGTYTATVTDAEGCTTISSTTVPLITILDADVDVTSNYSGQDISCFGASDGFVEASVVASSGLGPYTYEWGDATTTSNLDNRVSGIYLVTITDSRGCLATAQDTLFDPPAIVIDIDTLLDYTGFNISCNGASDASIEVMSTGGIGGHVYSWSHTASNAAIQSGLAANTYTVTVTDSENCVVSASVVISDPPPLTSGITTSDYNGFELSCIGASDGTITVNPTGGAGGYTYNWAHGPTTASLTNITTGFYEVTITDANGCTVVDNVSMDEPPALTFTTQTAAPTDCGIDNGIILISASGGTGNYEYSLDGVAYQTVNSFIGLASGNYSVYVRNEFGTCVTGPLSAAITPPSAPNIDNVIVLSPSVIGATDGGILVRPSGNGLAYRFRLDGGPWQSSDLFENLGEGTYSVEVSYVGQACVTSEVVDLIAGNGIVGNFGSFTQYCSADLSGTQFIETYYIPWPEDQVLQSLSSIYSFAGCGGSWLEPLDPIPTYNAIGVTEDNTIIVYDHFENEGYESNIAFPVQPSTEIWGDGITTNGFPPGIPSDLLNAGDIIVLENTVVSSTRADVLTDYDGGDKFASRGRLTYTRMAWASGTGSFLAGAIEVKPTNTWGTYFESPVGEDYLWSGSNDIFSYTGAVVMAGSFNTLVEVDLDGNGTADNSYILNEGESQLIDGGLDAGATITTSQPTQVHLITGDRCGVFEARLFTLPPVSDWSNSYLNPVASDPNDDATVVHVYNPNSTAINVTYEDEGGVEWTWGIAAGQTRGFLIQDDDSGSKFTSNDGDFYAIASIDSRFRSGGLFGDDDLTADKDWGFALIPEEQLSGQLSLVAFARGENPNANTGNNTSPIFVTPDYPTGSSSSGSIKICIDHDGDGGTTPDPFGGEPYDQFYQLQPLDMRKIFDPNDNDQSGTRIWVCDGSDAIIAGAWGLDADNSTGGNADEMDLGTGLANAIPFSVSKCVDLVNDFNSNGKFDECDEIQYKVVIRNVGSLSLSTGSLTLFDTLSSSIEYLPNSTRAVSTMGVTSIPDETVTSTNFPLDEDGYSIGQLIAPGDSLQILFDASINESNTAFFVNNKAYVSNVSLVLEPEVTFPVENPTAPEVPNIPVDTLISCAGTVIPPPFQDTCLSLAFLRQSRWFLQAASSEETLAETAPATNAFDGDAGTYWHTQYSAPAASYPHSIELDLGQLHVNINGFQVVPQQNSTNTHIGDYQFEYFDGSSWIIVATGTWTAGFDTKDVSFDNIDARYVRLTALSSASGTNFAGAAEINISKCATEVVYNEISNQTNDGTVTEFNYFIERTWSITDNCGNSGDQVQTITVTDTSAPVMVNIPPDETVDPSNVPDPPTIVASDDCQDPVTVVMDADTTYAGCTSMITRRWTVEDVTGNITVDSQVITINGGYNLTMAMIPVTCYNGNDGSTSTIPQGGAGPYTYNWSNSGNTDNISGLTAGWYYVTVTDVNLCPSIDSIEVTEPTELVANMTVQSHVSCEGGSDGGASVLATGGTGTKTYLWSNGGTSASISSVAAGTYDVTVTDASGCQTIGAVVINEPSAMNSAIEVVSNFSGFGVSCNGVSDGIAAVVPSGGTAPYAYSWSTTSTNDTIFNVNAGPYSVTITDANGCFEILSIDVTTPAPLLANAGNDVTICSGASSALFAAHSGGVGPYTYEWDNPTSTSQMKNVTPPSTTDYSVTVTDANGCTSIDVVRVNIGTCTEICNNNIDDDLDGDEDCDDSDCTYSTTVNVISDYFGQDVSCNAATDGSAFVLPQGGVGPHTFEWDDLSTNDTLSNVGAGKYFVTVTDFYGCTAIDSVELFEPTPISGTATIVANISCSGGTDGVLTANPSGGTAPYTYEWSAGGPATTKTISGVSKGSYTVTISDVNGCSTVAGVTISDAPALLPDAGLDQDVCIGSSVNLSASATGGAPGYTYLWDNGLGLGPNKTITASTTTTYEVIVTDDNGCQETDQITVTIIACPEDCTNGYDDDLDGLTDCDDPDCQFSTATSVVSDYNGQHISCYSATDDTITVVPFGGGQAPFSYLWSDGANTATTFENGVGSYYVTVTDNIGCVTLDTIEVISPTELVADAGSDLFMCLSQTVTLTATSIGGTGGVTYLWDNGLGAGNNHMVSPSDTTTYGVTITDVNGCTSIDSTRVVIQPCPEDCTNGIDDDLDGLLDCADSDCQFTLLIQGYPGYSTLCNGDASNSLKAIPLTSGTYTYVWGHGPTVDSIGDLGAGMYYVTVTNGNGCVSIDSVEITEPTVLTSYTSADQAICPGASIALIANGAGGTAPYTFVWDNSLGTGQSFIVNPLVDTKYMTTITDANGCTKLDSIQIVIIPCTEDCTNGIDDDLDGDTDCADSDCTYETTAEVISDYNGQDLSCAGASDGSARIIPVSGVAPHTFLWDEGTTNDTIIGMDARRYFVTITDGNGCTAIDSIDIIDPSALLLEAGPDMDICTAQSTTVTANPTNGVAPYSYIWDNGLGAGQGHLVAPTDTTMYRVTVTDANGCTAIDSVRVNITPCGEICNNNIDDDLDGDEDCDDSECSFPIGSAIISDYNGQHISCAGVSDGSAWAWPESGFAPFTYAWSDGSFTDTLFNASAGKYYVTITDVNLCSTIDSVEFVQPLTLSGTLGLDEDICLGSDVNLTATGLGGTGAYTYFWDNGLGAGSDHTVTPSDTTTYIVFITDANGCTYIDSTVVTLVPCIEDCTNGLDDDLDGLTDCDDPDCGMTTSTTLVSDYSSFNISCSGGDDGKAYVDILTGGSAPYSYLWSTNVYGDTISNGTVGRQYVTITDNNGCTAIDSVEFTEPPMLTVLTSGIDSICPDSSAIISASASGGVGGYTFIWDNSLGNGISHTVTPSSTTTYQVTAIDQNGCTATGIVVILLEGCVEICDNGLDDDYDGLIDCADPDCTYESNITILSDYNGTTISCEGADDGSLTVSTIGGVAPFTYSWNNAETSNINADLGPGQYHVTITDANGCTARDTIDIVEPSALQISDASNDVTCYGAGDGSIDLLVTGGTGSYTYDWNTDGAADYDDPEDLSNLDPGTYTVSVRDTNNCEIGRTVVISEPTELTISETTIDVACNGDASGKINVTVAGGVGPYNYQWDNDGVADTDDVDSLFNIVAGTYNLTVTDNTSCTQTASVTIAEPTVLNGSAMTTIADICRGATVTVSATGSGGVGPYTYAWDNSLGSGDSHMVSPMDSTTYGVTITDANDCTYSTSVDVNIIPCAEDCTNGIDDDLDGDTDCADSDCSYSVSINITSDYNGEYISCNGATDGSIATSILGGVAPFTYSWGGGETTSGLSNLGAGTYSVTVTDVNGCTGMVSETLAEPTALVLSHSSINASCFGASDGSIDLSVSGGTGGYAYDWSDDGTGDSDDTQDLSGLSTDIYFVSVSDANGCGANRIVEITEPTEIEINTTATALSCNGDNSATITTLVSGGVGPYTFDWSNDGVGDNDDTANLNGLIAGTYNLTVIDNTSCAQSASVTIAEPTALGGSAMTSTSDICRGVSVTVSATGSGGVGPYTYTWDNSLGSGDSHDVTPMNSTTYGVTITDANSCTYLTSIDINIIACAEDCTNGIDDDLDGDTDCDDSDCVYAVSINIISDYNGESISCNGATDGSIATSILGGVAPFTYSWGDGETTSGLSNLGAGTYSVTVTDVNGCTGMVSETLAEPTALVLSHSSINASCFGASDGSIDLSVSGGTGGYAYDWSDDGTGDSDDTQDLSGLSADIYFVSVSDANGCGATRIVEIIEPTEIQITTTATALSCNGDNSASITTVVSGGVGPYTFDWNNDGTGDNDDLANLNGLGAGTYNLTVTDNTSCTQTASVTIAEPTALGGSAMTSTSDICRGVTVTVSATGSGGVGPYTYTWDNSLGSGVSHDVTPMNSTTYGVTITDANSCTYLTSIDVDIIACAEDCTNGIDDDLDGDTDCADSDCGFAVSINITSDYNGESISCNGATDGSLTTSIFGGVAPFTYSWGGGETTSGLSNLGAGSYAVTVTDINGCSGTQTITLTEPLAVVLNHSSDDASCFGATDGNIDLSVTGGTGTYSYDWSDDGTGDSDDTQDLTGLPADIYFVSVTDANGCATSRNVEITEPAEIQVTTTATTLSCNGDNNASITTSISGGIGPYTFDWSNDGVGDNDDPVNLSGLSAGTYNLIVTDNTSCTQTASVVISEPSGLTGSATASTSDICRGVTVTISASGSEGVGPYTYNWDNSLGTGDSHMVTPMNSTTYSVIITDANSCTYATSVDINIIACAEDCTNGIDDDLDGDTDCADSDCGFAVTIDITSDYNGSPISCGSANDGSLMANVAGGVAPYSYDWSSGHNVQSISGLSAGNYSITVTDANGCSGQSSVSITDPAPLQTNHFSSDPTCFGISDGSIQLNVSGGTAPYIFDWDNDGLGDQDDSQNLSNLSGGSYFVEIRDANNCLLNYQVILTEPVEMSINLSPIGVTCNGGNDGSIDALITNGIAPFSYQWDNDGMADNDDTEDITDLSAGSYSLTVTDNSGCQATASSTVDAPNAIEPNRSPSANICDDEPLMIGLDPTGGTPPYSYEWNTGETTDSIQVLPAGAAYFSFTITDNVGCFEVDSILVEATFCNEPAIAVLIGGEDLCVVDSTNLTIVIVDNDGPGPYEIVLSNGNGLRDTLFDYQSGDSIVVSPLDTADYTIVSIKDALGLPGTSSGSALVNVIPDSDGDGICDPDDICNLGPNDDTDGDGTPDACQPCFGVATPNPPIAVQDSVSSCIGDQSVPFVVSVPSGIEVDWYDQAIDGQLISSNRTLYIPSGPLVLFAESRDAATGCTSDTRIRMVHTVLPLPVIDSLTAICSTDSTYYSVEFYSDASSVIADDGDLQSLGNSRYIIDSIFTRDDLNIYATGANSCVATFDVAPPVCRLYCVSTPIDTLVSRVAWESGLADICVPLEYDAIDDIVVIINDTFQTETIACLPDTGMVSTGIEFNLPNGIHKVGFTDLVRGCTDSLIVVIKEEFRDTIWISVYDGQSSSECLDPQVSAPTTSNVLENENETDQSLAFDWDNTLGCMSYEAFDLGSDTITIASSLISGDLIRTTLVVQVIELKDDIMNVTLPVGTDSMDMVAICLDTSELIGIAQPMEVGCAPDSSLVYQLDQEAYCINLGTAGELTDTICVVICDDLGGCDTTYIHIDTYNPLLSPVAINDTMNTAIETPVDIEVLLNDNFSGDVDDVIFMTIPSHGTVTLNDDMSISYIPVNGECGVIDSFMYSIVTQFGQDEAMVYIDISCDSLIVYTGFSPNGDGVNDGFTIRGIERIENNNVRIYNRWGNEVFDRDNYSNDDQWKGDWNNRDLPSGTYFYIICDSQGNNIKTGYVHILR